MANIYKNAITSLSTTNLTTVYTVPTATVAIIKTISVYNSNASIKDDCRDSKLF